MVLVQLILPALAVSTIEPLPVIVSVTGTWMIVKTGVTVWFWLIVT